MSAEPVMVVGLGASAGGIQAFKQFFERVPADSGMAYVAILHLSPEHESHLSSVLQAAATIPVTTVTDRVQVEPNHAYVVSPRQSLTMSDGWLVQSEATRIEERRAPIDIFFRTLAESHRSDAVCIVLSGTGADGSMGLKRVKEQGGLCLVQDPADAEYSDMPRNALATGLTDEVLPAADMPGRLVAYRNSRREVRLAEQPEDRRAPDERALHDVFSLVRLRTGHDFSNYKRATVLRRLGRRLGVRQLTSVEAYAEFLREHPEETQALLKDLLISVTNFFRDAEAFAVLEREVVPKLFANRDADAQVRAWIAGCATGEEAYSIAMLLAEYASSAPETPGVQIFATDLDEQAIAIAREGLYTLNDAADVSAERLRRFFTKEGEAYRVRKELREMVLFAHHNLVKDPPFSHLDLVSCRNLLIYLNRAAQQRVMDLLHFALNPNGFLFLGSSESVEGSHDLFAPVDKDAHIYQSRGGAAKMGVPAQTLSVTTGLRRVRHEAPEAPSRERQMAPDLHLRLLEQYAPPSVVVNEDYDIVYLTERAGRFLRFAAGEPSTNLVRVVRPELRLELRTALYQAAQQRTNVDTGVLAVSLDDDRATRVVIRVRPVLPHDDPVRRLLPGAVRGGDRPA
jgi:two-component system CheB/CheR fusion protein